MSAYAALAGRMQASLRDLEQVVNRAEALLGKAQQQNDADYSFLLSGLASTSSANGGRWALRTDGG